MRVMLVKWVIPNDDVEQFIRSWSTEFEPLNSRYVFEILCKQDADALDKSKTFGIEDIEKSETFITVGLWESEGDFYEAVYPYAKRKNYEFECLAMGRSCLRVHSARKGALPIEDFLVSESRLVR